MRTYHSDHFLNLTATILIGLVLFTGYVFGSFKENTVIISKVAASSAENISGFAWSDNIGFISFNCKDSNSGSTFDECSSIDYGVNVDRTIGVNFGLLSGRAWSEHIGWITFESAELANCPSGLCQARLGTDSNGAITAAPNNLTGWGRACSVFVNGCRGPLKTNSKLGGWDGFISLRGANYGVSFDPTDSKLKGYAWGDLVLGWINFNPLCSNCGVILSAGPVVTLAASDVNPPQNTPIALTWTVIGAASECHTIGGLFGWQSPVQKNPQGGSENTDPITAPQTFSIRCSNAFGFDDDEVTVQPQSQFSLTATPPRYPNVGFTVLSSANRTFTTTIKVIPKPGFNGTVVLNSPGSYSVTAMTAGNTPLPNGNITNGTSITFSRNSLSSAFYVEGSVATIVLPLGAPAADHYNVVFKGENEGLSAISPAVFQIFTGSTNIKPPIFEEIL